MKNYVTSFEKSSLINPKELKTQIDYEMVKDGGRHYHQGVCHARGAQSMLLSHS